MQNPVLTSSLRAWFVLLNSFTFHCTIFQITYLIFNRIVSWNKFLPSNPSCRWTLFDSVSSLLGASWGCIISRKGVSKSNCKFLSWLDAACFGISFMLKLSSIIYRGVYYYYYYFELCCITWQHTYKQALQHYKILPKQNSTTTRSSLQSNRSSSPNSFNISAINENEVDWNCFLIYGSVFFIHLSCMFCLFSLHQLICFEMFFR